jgi:hypothetical protein
MIGWKRISVVGSLVAYLAATTALHALHDHAAPEHSWAAGSGCDCGSAACCFDDACGCHPDDADETASTAESDRHHDPSPPADGKHICFACRLLAVKSISPVAVAVVEQSDVVRQPQPRPQTFIAVPRRSLPVSRGPPCA